MKQWEEQKIQVALNGEIFSDFSSGRLDNFNADLLMNVRKITCFDVNKGGEKKKQLKLLTPST